MGTWIGINSQFLELWSYTQEKHCSLERNTLGFGQGISIILNRMSMQRQKHSTDKNTDTSCFLEKKFFRIYYLSKLCLSWKQDYILVITRISDDQITTCYWTAPRLFTYAIINSSYHSITSFHMFQNRNKREKKEWVFNTLNLCSV